MALSEVKSVNVTKYDSGSEASTSYIADGYIKTVEKIWLDTYVFSAAIPSSAQLTIARIPKNKKITGIDIIFGALCSTASGTCTTISLGIASNTGCFLSAGEAASGIGRLSANIAGSTGASTAGLPYVTTSESTAVVATFERIATTTTAGTITTIVRYT